MKRILYNLLQSIDSDGNPLLSPVELGYSEANLVIAEKEAYNGYTIEDDGKSEPETKETTDDVLNALLGVTE